MAFRLDGTCSQTTRGWINKLLCCSGHNEAVLKAFNTVTAAVCRSKTGLRSQECEDVGKVVQSADLADMDFYQGPNKRLGKFGVVISRPGSLKGSVLSSTAPATATFHSLPFLPTTKALRLLLLLLSVSSSCSYDHFSCCCS